MRQSKNNPWVIFCQSKKELDPWESENIENIGTITNEKTEPNWNEANVILVAENCSVSDSLLLPDTNTQCISINILIFNAYMQQQMHLFCPIMAQNVSLGTSDILLSSGMAFLTSCTFALMGICDI